MIIRRAIIILTSAVPWLQVSAYPQSGAPRNHTSNEIPRYVLEYAPLVHLYSKEQFWPCDISEHLIHTTPYLNYTPIQARSDHPLLTNLDDLNQWNSGRYVYLKSDDNVETRPEWLGGKKNIPQSPSVKGSLKNQQFVLSNDDKSSEIRGGRSDAPAILIVIPKEDGIVDAFWFYFYSYNLGNIVLNIRFGNHIGDWEHSMVRFQDGEPTAVFFSEHNGGAAYTYDAVEKIGKRPVVYSATGTHANYATPGIHRYILPLGLLHDTTDRGPLWDPALNSYMYTLDLKSRTLLAGNLTPEVPTEWFWFAGHWGDKVYPLSDPRQYVFAGQYHYVTGPLGPRFKNLGRKSVCENYGPCDIQTTLQAQGVKEWVGEGDGENRGEHDFLEGVADGER